MNLLVLSVEMFKPQLSKSRKSLSQTRKTYSQAQSEYESIKITKTLDRDLHKALSYLEQAKLELKEYDMMESKSTAKRMRDISESSRQKKSKSNHLSVEIIKRNQRMSTPKIMTPVFSNAGSSSKGKNNKKWKTGGSVVRSSKIQKHMDKSYIKTKIDFNTDDQKLMTFDMSNSSQNELVQWNNSKYQPTSQTQDLRVEEIKDSKKIVIGQLNEKKTLNSDKKLKQRQAKPPRAAKVYSKFTFRL